MGNNRNRRGNRRGNVKHEQPELNLKEPRRATYTQQSNVVDYLSEDEEIPSQKFVCISFASITDDMREQYLREISGQLDMDKQLVEKVVNKWCEKEHPKRAVKVRGSTSTAEEIVNRAKRVRELDDNFHIFTCEVGKWLAFDPDPNMIEDENYMEEQLNELVKGYKQNKLKTKTHFEQRRRELIEKAIAEGTPEGQQIKMLEEEPIQSVEQRVKQADEYISELESKIEEAKRTKELAEKKLEQLSECDPEDIKDTSEVLSVDPSKLSGLDNETKSKINTLRDMQESARKAELGDLARELGNRQQHTFSQPSQQEALKQQLASEQFEEMSRDVLIPSQIRNDYTEEDKKGSSKELGATLIRDL